MPFSSFNHSKYIQTEKEMKQTSTPRKISTNISTSTILTTLKIVSTSRPLKKTSASLTETKLSTARTSMKSTELLITSKPLLINDTSLQTKETISTLTSLAVKHPKSSKTSTKDIVTKSSMNISTLPSTSTIKQLLPKKMPPMNTSSFNTKNNSLLELAPRSLDDIYEDFYKTTTRKSMKGEIDFPNIYKNSSTNYLTKTFCILITIILVHAF